MHSRFLIAAMAGVCAFGLADPPGAWAAHVAPTVVDGNPDCVDLGYDFGFKPQPEPPPSGQYSDGELEVEITSDGTFFDWSSNIGVDAVIVKGGSEGANVYEYDPEETSDTELTTPTEQEISHIEFCYDLEQLGIEKTVVPEHTITFEWEIDKSVTPASWELFTGDSGTSEYTVTLTKIEGDETFAVSGVITINNPAVTDADIASLTDFVNGTEVFPDCGGQTVVPAGGSLECTYEASGLTGDESENTATVTTNSPGFEPDESSVTEPFLFGPATEINGTVNVTDSFEGSLGSFSDSGSTTYERTFTCDADEGTHNNTATIDETGQSDSASVTVNCYALTVAKNATTTFTRDWDWTIVKQADECFGTGSVNEDPDGEGPQVSGCVAVLLNPPTQSLNLGFTAFLEADFTDSNWAVSGGITISNPAPIAATLTAVTDVVSPDIAATVDCPSLTVAANGSLECTYSADLTDGTERTNTATATLQNHSYDKDENPTPSGTTDFNSSAEPVTFGDPTTELDETVDVVDSIVGTICDGPVTATDSTTFETSCTFNIPIGPFENAAACEDHTDTVSFTTNDNEETGSSTWNIEVTCEEEFAQCPLTPGYWKTHSEVGPAAHPDDTWDEVGGPNATFFLSGRSYYEQLWLPKQGSAYNIAAFAWIATQLNLLAGADPDDIQDEFATLQEVFERCTPAEVEGIKGNRTLTCNSGVFTADLTRNEIIGLACVLDAYNNGLTVLGCSEEVPDTPLCDSNNAK